MLHHFRAVLLVQMDQHFGVALRAEGVPAAHEHRAQLTIVVDLPVIGNNNSPVLVLHRLFGARQIYNAEARMAQHAATCGRRPRALSIRAAIAERGDHSRDVIRRGRWTASHPATDSTQVATLLFTIS